MVVCVCNAIREKDVRQAARGAAMSPGRLYQSLGCRLQCGQCVPFAREIIKSERALAC